MIESVSFKGPWATIKTHHNVGGLPPNMRFKLLMEPLRGCFKGKGPAPVGRWDHRMGPHLEPDHQRGGRSALARRTAW